MQAEGRRRVALALGVHDRVGEKSPIRLLRLQPRLLKTCMEFAGDSRLVLDDGDLYSFDERLRVAHSASVKGLVSENEAINGVDDGIAMVFGDGQVQDILAGVNILKANARAGSGFAQEWVAHCWLGQVGVVEPVSQYAGPGSLDHVVDTALFWYSRAACLGQSTAMVNLATLIGVRQPKGFNLISALKHRPRHAGLLCERARQLHHRGAEQLLQQINAEEECSTIKSNADVLPEDGKRNECGYVFLSGSGCFK